MMQSIGSVGVLLTLVLVLAVGGRAGAEAVMPAADCSAACYAAKSEAYQRCRSIPAHQRPARTSCFRRADAALARCLRQCPSAS